MNEFRYPLVLLLFIPYFAMLAAFLFRRTGRAEGAAAVSSSAIIRGRRGFLAATYPWLTAFRFFAIACIIIALARPGKGVSSSNVQNLGIDIMIALDVSASMEGEDFEPKNRLEVAKLAVADFVAKRGTDRIGMVVFAGEAYLQCPLTLDHDVLFDILDELDFSSVSVDGTAIGDALSLCAARMMDSKSKSRIILLITDGVNNMGSMDPATAASVCKDLGIKIYSLGIGKEGIVPYPGGLFGKRSMSNSFDPSVLENASALTGGKFYRAETTGVFLEDMREIDLLEKSAIDVKKYHEFTDKFSLFIAAGMIAFFIEVLLRSIVYRKLP